MHEITYEFKGINYTAQYTVDNDELVVYLPDGTTRSTMLRGLKPETAAMPHLISYVKSVAINKPKR